MPTSASASALDLYNSHHRKKTLVEEHLERLAKGGGVSSAGTTKPSAPPAPATATAVAAPSGRDAKGSPSSSEISGGSSDSDSSGDEAKRSKHKKRKREKGEKSKSSSKKKKHKKEKKAKKERSKGKPESAGGSVPEAAAKPAWVGDHPWRPFDRDKDLDLKPKAQNPEQMIKTAAALSAGRFQSAGGTRHFL